MAKATAARPRSLREQILARRDAPGLTITPSFLDGQAVDVVIMTVAERRDLITQATNDEGERDAAEFEALTVIHCVCIAGTKERLFKLGDKDALMELPATVLDELAEPALRINGLLISSVPDVETARKNSRATPSGSPNTDLPNDSE